jgi:quinol monooxygenase YgiN
MKYLLIAFIHMLPGKEADVITAMQQLAEAARKEPGCGRFDVYLDEKNPLILVVLEDYRDEAAFRVHVQASYTKEILVRIAGKMQGGKPEVVILKPAP